MQKMYTLKQSILEMGTIIKLYIVLSLDVTNV